MKTVPDGNAFPRRSINRLFDDLYLEGHNSHMLASALASTFERVVPEVSTETVVLPGYVAVSIEARQVLMYLVHNVAKLCRLSSRRRSRIWKAPPKTRPWRNSLSEGRDNG